MAKKDWSNLSAIAFVPILFVIIVYAVEAYTRYSFFGCVSDNCKPIPANIWKVLNADTKTGALPPEGDLVTDQERQLTALRFSGRINWYFLSDIFLYVCLSSLIVSVVISYKVSPHPHIAWTLGILILSAVDWLFFHANQQFHMAVFIALFDKAITSDVHNIADSVNFLNSIGNASLLALLLTICMTLLPLPGNSEAEDLKELSVRTKYFNIALYSGTALLVTGMLIKLSIYQWTLAFIVQDNSVDIAKNFLNSLLTWEGGFYTLVLAAAYLPSMLILQRRASISMDPSMPEQEKDTKLKDLGVNFSLRESLPHILAILAPFLTGPVGDFLTGKFF